ncbi:type II toxin-antitoxin system HigB family toxin [Endozoicomonas ascidiicola]|uniref:type II toxin-antitoxin system HigB family toxin n=1 Tax=Endozoicomonas ascidiicola TaxID=1698521 RepID=UPI0008318584|nr:type II toxin-antitoxin system HigB family toxin [Endozoicomonas ascidiicola]
MHIIAKKKFVEAAQKHPRYSDAIMETYQVLSKSSFTDAHVLQRTFKSLERFRYDKDAYIIDISGNHMRLIGIFYFKSQKVFIKHIVDHKEYDQIIKRCRKGGKL